MKTYGTSRGLRNHNPCNLRPCKLPDVWKGQVGIDDAEGGPFSIMGDFDGQEADFWGLRDGAHNFLSYQRIDGLQTIGQIIQRHAPPADDNDTAAYIAFVCRGLGVSATDQVALAANHELLFNLVKFVCKEEEGTDPYPDDMIRSAILAA
jgi:hypothetical protein